MPRGRHLVDRVGHRYGLLLVEKLAYVQRPSPLISRPYWKCLCDCGNYTIVRGGNLQQGSTLSCGCEKLRRQKAAVSTHGHSSGGVISRTYNSWRTMVRRCTEPTNKDWFRYGGRGIKVCTRWLKFENFLADMGERPTGKTLDRKDNYKGYSKVNCRWATYLQQRHNRRSEGKQ